MRFLAILAMVMGIPLIGMADEPDLRIWEHAYLGEYSLVHKEMLCRKSESFEQKMLNFLLMAYLYHRQGQPESVLRVFEGIDIVIEQEALRLGLSLQSQSP